MKRSSIAIGAIWLLSLFGALKQGYELPVAPLADQLRLDHFGLIVPLLSFAFFVGAPFFQRHKQFTWPLITRKVDARFGDGAFARFLTGLRPTMLSIVACLTIGGTGLLWTHVTTQTISAYVASAFFLAGGLGLLSAYMLSIKFPPRLV
jgi:hypothetical protein